MAPAELDAADEAPDRKDALVALVMAKEDPVSSVRDLTFACLSLCLGDRRHNCADL